MTTTNIKAFNGTPYFDDYFRDYGGETVETKNYHRILFRPGFAVQARELTQMQTMLQAQIDRHGQYAFKDGSRVVNGEVSLNVEYDYIKLEPSFTYNSTAYPNATSNLSALKGSLITGTNSSGNQVTALVLDTVSAAGSDPDTLYIKYQKSGGTDSANLTVQKFDAGEVFVSNGDTPRYGMIGGGNNVDGSNTASTISNGVGIGSAVSISEGVYFIAGCFVYVGSSTLLLDKYTNNPSYIIGLKVVEDVITSSTDATLVDNAQGVPNTSAPGANRYQIATSLIKQPIDINSRTIDQYITLLTVNNGEITIDKTDKTSDTGLTLRLAQRTHDESGDYVVKPFELEILEHLNDNTNFGKYTAAQGGSADKIALGVEPSTAYVQGYRNHKVGTTYIDIDKPRGDTADGFINESNTQINIGNYIKLNTSGLRGVPDLEGFTPIDLKISGTARGDARVRGMEEFSGEIRLYLFDINMDSGYSFSAVDSVSQALYGFQANLDANSVGTRFDVGNNTAVFQLPQAAIRTLADPSRDTTYSIKAIIPATTTSSGGLSITTTAGLFEDTDDIIIAPTGQDVKTDVSAHRVIGTGDGMTGVTYTNGIGIGNSIACNVIATIKKTVAPKGKLNTTEAKTINVTNGDAASYGLGKADIIKLVSIIDSQGTDHINNFTLDNGQRDNFYDEGKIIKNSGTAPVATGNMVVTFKYYEHTAGDYFCVDSYPTSDYADIPSFTGSGGNLQLRDCIDFRPRKADGANNFTGSTASLSGAPKVGHALTADISYYLPRIDKLVIKRSGEFEVITGVPSEYPQPPADKNDALTLYQLKLKPYVFTLSDVIPEIQDNKRYTMKDIGKLDKRIKNLEYYTSLSLLEQSAADIHMVDSAGLTRFKNGILVDSFKNQGVADMAHEECSESIDKENGLLRPECPSKNVNLITKTSGVTNTASKSGSLWHMPFTEVAHTVQPYASLSINVNPYNVFSWAGRVQLSPESDEWKETEVRPDVVIDDDGQYEQFVTRAKEDGILGTVWNEWETNWTGRQVETEVQNRGRGARMTNGRRGNGPDFWWARMEPEPGLQQNITSTTVTSNQARTGLRTDVTFDTVTKETGNRVVEINFIPFMRSRKIYFKASRMKPNTKVYAFFNDVDVTAYCKSESYVEWSDSTGVVELSGETSHPDSESGTLAVDNLGKVSGSFVIPRNDTLKFKTGTKEFRLSDSTTNDKQTEVTSAETLFHAQGLIESTERTIVSTKVPRLETTRLNETRVISETFRRQTTNWSDPLAQTILIEKSGGIFATSIDLFFRRKFVVKAGDDAEVPVSISIVTAENGIPTQTVIPGAEAELFPSAVNISETAVSATRFTFEHPVYLLQDQEYAIVIQSDCDEYECWIAEMGGRDVTNQNYRINKQPHGGSFFTSQNASTWTPDQSKDLKFTLNRAQFDVTAEKEVTFVNDTIQPRKLLPDSLSSTSGSTNVVVRHRNHSMHGNSTVVISGATAFNGLSAADINGTHSVSNIKHDSYTISVGSSNASATGSGGGAVITATENRHMDLFHLIAGTSIVPETDIRFSIISTSQKSINGSEIPYAAQDEIEILPNMNQIFDTPKLIASSNNESGGNKTFTLKAKMSSLKDHLSPILDANRLSLITVQNRIGDNGDVSETNAYGGSELCKYITKKVDLSEEADVINIYLSANRPAGSNIDVYYKTLAAGSDVDFNSLDWTLINPADIIPTSDDASVYSESKYVAEPSGSFGSMAFKIILRSKNSSKTPTIKDFRAIAAT